MTMRKINLADFDFSEFKAEAIEQLKNGQSLTGLRAVFLHH